jgi:geranylgeranyl pyrophosphate synthase
MGPGEGKTEAIAREWLGRAGKRWRPFLTVAAYNALRSNPDAALPEALRKIAVAVECFHKASLIHDDIEDQDAERYGEKTLHEEHGVAIALNVGDLLIGEGYRLIAEAEISAKQKAEMFLVASRGQQELCRGQGSELVWSRNPEPLSSRHVLGIFQKKTAPAFEVALRLGAIFADRHDEVADALGEYSEALGIAYQIRDDLNDIDETGDPNDIAALRPNILLGLAWERAKGQDKEVIESLWKRQVPEGMDVAAIRQLYHDLGAIERAKHLLETYKETAVRSLAEVEVPNLKGLLRRTLGKIFNDTEIKGWCKEFEEKNGVRDGRAISQENSEVEMAMGKG